MKPDIYSNHAPIDTGQKIKKVKSRLPMLLVYCRRLTSMTYIDIKDVEIKCSVFRS